MVTKTEILRDLATLPEDATLEDAMERLYMLMVIDRGIQQVAEGKTQTQEQVESRNRLWQK
jgi:hypothetical protein